MSSAPLDGPVGDVKVARERHEDALGRLMARLGAVT